MEEHEVKSFREDARRPVGLLPRARAIADYSTMHVRACVASFRGDSRGFSATVLPETPLHPSSVQVVAAAHRCPLRCLRHSLCQSSSVSPLSLACPARPLPTPARLRMPERSPCCCRPSRPALSPAALPPPPLPPPLSWPSWQPCAAWRPT